MYEFSIKQQNYRRTRVCGDVVNYMLQEDGVKVVMCDGLGHGVKANILANLTSKVVVNHDFKREPLRQLIKDILSIQPVCSKRRMNHSTYTLLDYSQTNNEIELVNYDNPKPLVYCNGDFVELPWKDELNAHYAPRPQKISFTTFTSQKGMYIVLFSDGITQSGVGNSYSFGWGEKNIKKFIEERILTDNSADEIATSIVSEALKHENDSARDDMTCIVIKIVK